MNEKAQCQDCGWEGDAGACHPLRDVAERVAPGEEMPAGECPRCGAAAMLVRARNAPAVRIETLRDGDGATRFARVSQARAVRDVMALTGNLYRYTVEGPDERGFRVAAHRGARTGRATLHGYMALRAC